MELDLDDWPSALILFWDADFLDPTSTAIAAEIYALTPIVDPHIAGDYDYDGDVDDDDYIVWKLSFGDDVLHYADGNGVGVVDSADYVVWRNHLGQTTPSGSITNNIVPEPATFALVALVVAGRWLRRNGLICSGKLRMRQVNGGSSHLASSIPN